MKQQLCPTCRIGKIFYELDPGNPECPYIAMNNGKFCAKYEAFEVSSPDTLSENVLVLSQSGNNE